MFVRQCWIISLLIYSHLLSWFISASTVYEKHCWEPWDVPLKWHYRQCTLTTQEITALSWTQPRFAAGNSARAIEINRHKCKYPACCCRRWRCLRPILKVILNRRVKMWTRPWGEWFLRIVNSFLALSVFYQETEMWPVI